MLASSLSITPVSFLVIQESTVRVLSVDQPASTVAERVIDLVPDVVNKVSHMVSKKKDESADTVGETEE